MSQTVEKTEIVPTVIEKIDIAESKNPINHAIGKNGVWLTAGIIVADVVGAGILGMPRAVAQLGGVPGTVVLIIMLAANVHISILMWRVRMGAPGCTKSVTYYELASGSFEKAPAWQKKIASWAATFSQMSFLFGLLGLYLLSAGKGFGYMFFNYEVCLPVWALLATLVLLPFACTSREMGTHAWLVWANIVTLMGTIIIPLTYYLFFGIDELNLGEHDSKPLFFARQYSFTNVLSALSTFTFGMTSQFMLTEIMSEMQDPANLPVAYVRVSAPFQLVAFLVAGLGGYSLFGDKVQGMINENLPFGPAFQASAACLVVHMLVSYLIKGVVMCQAVHRVADRDFSSSQDTRTRSRMGWCTSVLFIAALAYLTANVVPFFSDAVDLLGASVTPLSCWILPIAMFARYYYDTEPEHRPNVSTLEWVIMAGEMLLAVTLVIFGTYAAMRTIVEDWHTYGYPFACHCEGTWNTCQCSSHHVGMDACLAQSGTR